MTSEHKRIILKFLCYGATSLLLWIIQLKIIGNVRIFGATPLIAPFMAVTIGAFEGAFPGAICGCVIGFFADAASIQTEGMYAVILLLIGFGAGICTEMYFKKNLLNVLFLGAVGYCAVQTVFFLAYLIVTEYAGAKNIVTVFTGLISTVIYAPIIYLVYFAVYRRFLADEEEERANEHARIKNIGFKR